MAEFGTEAVYDKVRGYAAVLGGPHYKMHGMSSRLRAMGIVSVPCVEYSLRTRLDIIRHEVASIPRAARRAAWELREELRVLRDIKAAHGVQCNGTPTFDAYSGVNDNAHLYFDTRTAEASFATSQDLGRRAEHLRNGGPLRIAFSGRLLEIKGAHHLIPMARYLRERGVDFELTICGGGKLAEEIARSIPWNGLPRYVKYAGVLDFNTQLLPMLKQEIDLFVAPHLQGDPSCTYLETLACGVPIVGYANEAWSGILERAPVGWASSVGNPYKLAKTIAGISRNDLGEKAREALAFARQHSFEKTFDRRIEHLAGLVRANQKSA